MKRFYPSKAVSKISEIIKARYDKPWIEWKEIPIEHKKMMFEEFKIKCTWEEVDHKEIVRIWKRKSAQIVRQSLSDIRRDKASGIWLGTNVLKALKHKWNTDPAFLNKSERNKKNASANKNGRVNRSGAISISEHRLRAEKKLGRSVSIPELFENMNVKKGKWMNQQSEIIIEKFKKIKGDALSQGKVVDDSTIFFEASVGTSSRGRSWGFGNEALKYNSSSKRRVGQSNILEVERLQDRVKQLEENNQRLESEMGDVKQLKQQNERLESELTKIQSFIKGLGYRSSMYVDDNGGEDQRVVGDDGCARDDGADDNGNGNDGADARYDDDDDGRDVGEDDFIYN